MVNCVQAGPIIFMSAKEVFGAAVRLKRMKLGMSQETLGLKIGLDQGYVSRIEQGKMNITLDTMEEICKVLQADVAEMFGGGG